MAGAEEPVSADEEEMPNYVDELTGLVEPKQDMMFSTSTTILTKPDPTMHPMGQAIGIFLLFICLLGFLNGVDYASPHSGLVRPADFVHQLSQTAPDETATFRGNVYDHENEPMANVTVYISWDDNGIWNSSEVLTDENGYYNIEKLDPGLVRVDIIAERDGFRDVFSNRVLLSPPALIEPIGFTTINFVVPSQTVFDSQPCSNGEEEFEIRYVDLTAEQTVDPLMDSGAESVYISIGFGFMGLSLIATGFTVWAMKNGSIVVLRTAAGLSFFTVGHYYTACCFGIMAFVLTFAVPKRYIPMKERFQ